MKKRGGRKPAKTGLSPTEQASVRLQHALHAGFVIYLMNQGMSVTAVWETGRISAEDAAPFIRDCIALDTFVKSATENGWVARRSQHWQDVRTRVENKLLHEHVQRSLDDIAVLQGAKTIAMQHIRGDVAAKIDPVRPKSLEGVLGALVQLTKAEAELRKIVVEQAADAARDDARVGATQDPQLPGAAAALVTDDDGFTDEQIAAMARAAALQNALGGVPEPPAQLTGPVVPALPVGDNTKVVGDNERLLRPVMEPP